MLTSPLQIMPGGRIPLGIAEVHEVELLELLGVGGYGSIWKATDTTTSRLYTLKIIQGIVPGSVQAERVRLEAEVSIPSDYIVPVIGLREWGAGTFLILFEYFKSTSLEKILEEGILTSNQKKRILIQTLTGVADAHRNNVIHRDLKPGNILVGDDGTTKLIDFGISKFKGTPNITRSGEIIGTIAYMAPELIIRGARVADARCDVFSLGHIFYELSMGEHFWKRKGWSELKDLMEYLSQVPPPAEAIELRDFHCDFFTDSRGVLQRMIKLDPEQRYDTVDDILIDLGEPIPSVPLPPPDLHLRSPLLIVESGTNRLARTVLGLRAGERREIGRHDLAGADSSVGRHHLEFSREGNRYYVRDLGSKNGTIVRGIMLKPGDSPLEIHHADRIKVGDVFLRFVFLKTL